MGLEITHVFGHAVSSMAYMILQEAKDLRMDEGFHEELMNWIGTFDESTEPEILGFIAQEVEVELRDGWDAKGYGSSDYLSRLAAYLGEGYEEEIFYHIVKTSIHRIKEEDSHDDTDGREDQSTT